ncbi:carboxypeptidase regulatory-like domain-containing protein [Halobellus sp. Atlit-31R]|nr:carboxypeptidase regulatory-like domain-containing protein [Halobellus sp. Atlit-31R]
MLDELRQFATDDRAIEGLPIRLVIALVVGVATMSVMLNMLSGMQGLAVSELDVQPSPDVVQPGEQELKLTVVDDDGDGVEGATVIVKDGSAEIGDVATARSDGDGVATVTVEPETRANQETGTLVVDVKPPSGSQFVDRRSNTEILVVEE